MNTILMLTGAALITIGVFAFCMFIRNCINKPEPEECRMCAQRFNFNDRAVPPCLYCHKFIKK